MSIVKSGALKDVYDKLILAAVISEKQMIIKLKQKRRINYG